MAAAEVARRDEKMEHIRNTLEETIDEIKLLKLEMHAATKGTESDKPLMAHCCTIVEVLRKLKKEL